MQNWLYIIQPYSISYSQSLMNKVLDSFLKSRAIGNLMVLYTLFCLTLHVFIWLNKCILRALLYSLERSFRHRGMTTGGVLGLASKVWKWPKSDHQRFMYAPVLYVVDWMKPLRRWIKVCMLVCTALEKSFRLLYWWFMKNIVGNQFCTTM